jgi:hypothetical protein
LETAARPVLNKPFNAQTLCAFIDQLATKAVTPAAYLP